LRQAIVFRSGGLCASVRLALTWTDLCRGHHDQADCVAHGPDLHWTFIQRRL